MLAGLRLALSVGLAVVRAAGRRGHQGGGVRLEGAGRAGDRAGGPLLIWRADTAQAGQIGQASPWAARSFPVPIGAAVLIGAGSGQKKSQGGRRGPFTLAFFVSTADRGGGGSFPVLIGAGAGGHWFRLHLIHPHGAPGTGPADTVPGRHSFAAG